MNSLKNMFRPTKPISKNVSFKPDELISNSQKVSLQILELLTYSFHLQIQNKRTYSLYS